jgi:hypothetical protein
LLRNTNAQEMVMNRRDWLKGGAALAAAAGVSTKMSEAQAAPAAAREYYLFRKYSLNRGLQSTSVAKYFQEALVPALGRMGLGPVGVFTLTYGEGTPMMVLLVPSADISKLTNLDLNLAKDAAFMAAAKPYWGAPVAAPIFDRIQSSISIAFEGFPKLIAPAKEPRLLQIRTYESPTEASHVLKVEMFHQGEFRIFEEAGAKGVLYSDNLIGDRLPSLTYMLCHKDLASVTQNWKNFTSHPDWKKLAANPRYATDPIVSRVDDLLLTPTAYSQV